QLYRPAVPADAEIPDLAHVGDPSQAGLQPPDGPQVASAQSPATSDHHGHRGLVHPLEGSGQPGGVRAGAAGRQEARVAGVGHAGQRREEVLGQHGGDDPGRDDDPAEADGEPAYGSEEPGHASLFRQSEGADGIARASVVDSKPMTSWPRSASRKGWKLPQTRQRRTAPSVSTSLTPDARATCRAGAGPVKLTSTRRTGS